MESAQAKKDRKSRSPILRLLCVLCNQSLRHRCIECRLGYHREPCWVILDSKNGYRHTHCDNQRKRK